MVLAMWVGRRRDELAFTKLSEEAPKFIYGDESPLGVAIS